MRFNRWVWAWTVSVVSAVLADVPVRVATYNLEVFNQSPGNAKFEALVDILQRTCPDVVCVQEVDASASFDSLAASAGYPHKFLASTSNGIDFNFRSGVYSKYPIAVASFETSITLSGDSDAKDLTRNFVVAAIDVPGAAVDLVIIGNHWKSGGTDDADEIRRSIESIRAMQIVDRYDSTVDPLFVVGDMNDDLNDGPDSPVNFNSLPGGLPASFSLGADMSFPIPNGVFLPLQAGAGPSNLTVVNALQLDGSDATRNSSGRRLDYLWRSDAVVVVGTEVYDSADEGLGGGRPKCGAALPAGTSATASDHLLVLVDILLAEDGPFGACCTLGLCTDDLSPAECAAGGGLYQGDNSLCVSVNCPSGACCTAGNCANDTAQATCVSGGGSYQGDGSTCASVMCPNPTAALNEIRIDQLNNDNDEYFELVGTPGHVLTGLTYLVIGDGTGGSGVIEAIVDLTGATIPVDGYFFAAESTFTLGPTPDLETALNFENSDNVTHLLVDGFSGTNGQDLDTNDDGVLDLTPWNEIVDCVGLIATVGSGDFLYCTTTVGPEGIFVPGHVYRFPNETGPWQIGTFDPVGATDTPGVPNTGIGACCTAEVCTAPVSDFTCAAGGGQFQGVGTDCGSVICDAGCVNPNDCDDSLLCTLDACDLGSCAAETILYGDVNGDGFVNADDGLCLVDTFSGTPNPSSCFNATTQAQAVFEAKDIAPCPTAGDPNNMGDGFINADDALAALDKFAGMVQNPACAACLGSP